MLIVHLFVSYAHVNLCHFSLPPGVGGWLRLLLVALPECFCLHFSIAMAIKQIHVWTKMLCLVEDYPRNISVKLLSKYLQ